MNNNFRDWKRLPVEILQIVLQLASTRSSTFESCNFALVCKAWKNTAQAVSYSNVTLSTMSQLRKFHGIIVQNPNLGNKIKTLDLQFIDETDKIEATKLLTSLLTTFVPNLEILKKNNSHIPIPPLTTQQKNLRRLQHPHGFNTSKEFEGYVDNALLLKDKLENIYIMCTESFRREWFSKNLNIQYQRLYDNLYQFKNLQEITLMREANDEVQVFEYIVESCNSLKKIDVDLKILSKNVISTEDISKYTPNVNVKSLSVTIHGSKNGNKLLSYIMHKFPKLQSLSLDLDEKDALCDAHLVTRMLDYMSKIDEIDLKGLSVNKNNLLETIGDFWMKTSNPGSESLYVDYSDYCSKNIKTALDIRKKSNGKRVETTLRYPTNIAFAWKSFMDFVQKMSEFIGALYFQIKIEGLVICADLIYQNVLYQIYFHIVETLRIYI